MRKQTIALFLMLQFATAARAGAIFDDGLVHDISDNSFAGCMVDVRSGPGGTTTTLNVLPGAVIDSGADATALNTSTGEHSAINISGGSINGIVAGFVGQTAGPHTISGGNIHGGKWSLVLREGTYSLTGGMITGQIAGWFRQNAVVELDGTTLDGDGAALITDNAQLRIHSGLLRSVNFYAITASHSSVTHVYGGSITGIEAGGASAVFVYGGNISNPSSRQDAVSTRQGTVHIHGGTIASSAGPELMTWQGEIHVHGSNFNHPAGPLPITGAGTVTGTLEDGTDFSWAYSNVNGGNILLIETTVGTEWSTWGAVKSLYR